ncbi:MAG TPA: dihydropteroate synthase [Burkholderiaceae bacterium]|nr:dihydropteroate synthase [Burkholderiaceae bacterium]
MKNPGGGLIIIGENFNTTRKIKATSPKVVRNGNKVGIGYVDLDGNKKVLDVTRVMPEDPNAAKNFMIPHVGEACRQKDISYIRWAIKNQEKHGAHIIDVCVDELSVYPEERMGWMRWVVQIAQDITDAIISIDSSDSNTIKAGLEVHDSKKSRPAINSFNLEPGRQVLLDVARERKALLFANASGTSGMPQSATERIDNMTRCMEMMDQGNIPMGDRFLDPLVFPIGAGPAFGMHYIEAVRELHQRYPEVHIFGGHSNVSFGLPERKLLNNTFVAMSILAGADTAMIDPIMNSPKELNDFRFAANALSGADEYSTQYLKYIRSLNPPAPKVRPAA